nr:hypothetical protein [Tanacetum cinerariifolium]
MGQCKDDPGRFRINQKRLGITAGRLNRGQGNNPRGGGAAGYKGAQNRDRNANPGQARQIKCYNCNDPILGNNKWYQSLLRSFDQKKNNTQAPTEFALMAKSSLSFENEVYDDSFCSKSCRKNTENLNTNITKLNEELSDSENTLYHYKIGLSQVEARLVEFKTQEIKFCEKIRGLARDVEVRNNKIENLINELELVKKEKDSLDNKLSGFESTSKDLDTLLGSQRTDKNKEGLGYSAVLPLLLKPTPSIDSSKSNTSDLQNSNFSVFEHGESSISITFKPMINFVKAADCPGVFKTYTTETAKKSPVKYAEMYRI